MDIASMNCNNLIRNISILFNYNVGHSRLLPTVEEQKDALFVIYRPLPTSPKVEEQKGAMFVIYRPLPTSPKVEEQKDAILFLLLIFLMFTMKSMLLLTLLETWRNS